MTISLRKLSDRVYYLTTNGDLHTARALYEKFGFAIVHQEKKQYSGYELVDETWERSLLS
ncbi:hypothetical protein [Halalkalibacterium halodurans]|uniref:hypothetical protein n=1 Tax=Halalkalibacterium halodurans TaxID=86665 RepID=UPI0010FE0275|nr:hypothetical protein [Halalkalibacterium halodurans]